MAAGDLNHDGSVDLIASSEQSNQITVLLNDGSWPPLPPGPDRSDVPRRSPDASSTQPSSMPAANTTSGSAETAPATGRRSLAAGLPYRGARRTPPLDPWTAAAFPAIDAAVILW
jgi:hypothetical protein